MDDTQSIRPYLNAAGEFPRLSAEDERRLAIAIQMARWELTQPEDLRDLEVIKRGRLARAQMIEANLLLVVKFARERPRKSFPLAEAIQCGNIGLMHAADHYDPNYRTKTGETARFSTYAKSWILKEISKGAKLDLRSVRLPDNMIETIGTIKRVMRRIEATGIEPTFEQIADDLGMTVTEVECALMYDRETLSLDHPLADDEEHLTLGDTVADHASNAPSDHIEQQEMSDGMHDLLFSLTDAERMMVTMRFGFGSGRTQTLEDVAREFGLTRERVRQREGVALAKLSRPSRKAYLKSIQ